MTLRADWEAGEPLETGAARVCDDVRRVRELANSFLVDPADQPKPVSDALWVLGIAIALVLAVGLVVGCAIGAAGHAHPLFVVQSVFVAGVVIIVLASAVTHR